MDEIVASVIVPCWNVAPWIDAALTSVLAAADRLAPRRVEILCVDDGSTDATPALLAARAAADARLHVLTQPNRGQGAARNAALDLAHGKYVFFMDPDDTVEPDFLSAGVAAMDRSAADWCVFPYSMRVREDAPFQAQPLKGDYNFQDNAAVVRGFVARLIGYSFDDLRRWFAGEELFAPREFGSVCRCVYRRDLIERHHVRFDAFILIWEDAVFNCAYLLHAAHTVALGIPLYNYAVRPSGSMTQRSRSAVQVENKFRMLAARRQLDAEAGGRLTPLYAGSCVLAPLEILATCLRTGLGPLGAVRKTCAYLRDPVVAAAVRACPLSGRRPVFSLGVLGLRVLLMLAGRSRGVESDSSNP